MMRLSVALAVTIMATPALAGEISQASVPGNAAPSAASNSPTWLANVSGVKLVAVDGSTFSLTPTEGGLTLALISQNGAAQRSSFAFMSDKLGTVSEDSDPGRVTGFFRETDNGFEAQFADGRTQSLVANTAGGLTLTIRNGTDASCTSWYPPDHAFSASERRAALAAYADRLGLGDKAKKTPHAAAVCAPAIRVVKNKTLPGNVQPLVVVTHPNSQSAPMKTDISTTGTGGTSGLIPIMVRSSPVHAVDIPVVQPVLAAPQLIQASASLSAATGPALIKTSTPVPTTQPATVTTTQASLIPTVAPGSGASDCLSVDADGTNLGFRNHCAYGVQVAYCLQRASEAAASCDTGSKSGSVSANGFVAVLLDTNIKTSDAEHDFRWVACSGDTGDIVARLDRSDPPMGRCVRAGAL